jgi:hypothetical protein
MEVPARPIMATSNHAPNRKSETIARMMSKNAMKSQYLDEDNGEYGREEVAVNPDKKRSPVPELLHGADAGFFEKLRVFATNTFDAIEVGHIGPFENLGFAQFRLCGKLLTILAAFCLLEQTVHTPNTDLA